METIFTIKNEDFSKLNVQQSVDFFADLLWAEARRKGMPVNKVNVSKRINVSDGGIDASIQGVQGQLDDSWINEGFFGYQIKTGNFFPWQDQVIKKELFGNGDAKKENLGESIKYCLDQNGCYTIVCFGQEPTENQYRQSLEHLKKYLSQCGYSDPKVEVWGQSKLASFTSIFPSLSLELNGRGSARFQSFKGWSLQDDMRKNFEAGDEQSEVISKLQDAIRQGNAAIHIRGEAGVGKTKLILEAVRAEDLSPAVIYCDSANKFRDSDLMGEILKDDNNFSAILVVDECNFDSRSYILNKLKSKSNRITFISIYNEYDESPSNIIYFDTPTLNNEQIKKIIQSYGFDENQTDRWVDLCSGSPRVAHVIGTNLQNNPEDLLKPLDTVNIWDRYIVGCDNPNDVKVIQRHLTLNYLALFKRFGYGKFVVEESKVIAEMINQADSQITWQKFQEIIRELKDRKILQGDNTFYITPKALHIYLWKEWWDTYGGDFAFDEFSKKIPKSLIAWFYEMFTYAAESQTASRIVKELLGENGPFKDDKYLQTELGASFFLNLSEADPKTALEYIKKIIDQWSKEKLLKFRTGRREVIWALEKMAVWEDLFVDAARLLLRLGESENESWSNNATGVFRELFSPGYGRVAPTEMPPLGRVPVLVEALDSDSKEKRLIALSACDPALESQHFSRSIGHEYQGLRKTAQLWQPKTWGELFDYYRAIWGMLSERIDDMEKDEQDKTVDIFLRHCRNIGRIKNLEDMAIKTIEELIKKDYVDKKIILAEVIRLLHYERKYLSPEIIKRWEKIKDDLTGSDFRSLMNRYVAMDVLEDKFSESGEYADQIQNIIIDLAQQAINNFNLLKPELQWLMTAEARNGFRFAQELGKLDNNFLLLPNLIDEQKRISDNPSLYFLGGYFSVLFQKDPKKWGLELERLSKDSDFVLWVPELTWRSGMTDAAALRILRILKDDQVDIKRLHFFVYGSYVNDLSEDTMKEWLEFLLSKPDSFATSLALSIFYSYYIRKKEDTQVELPKELALRLLIHPSLFNPAENNRRDQMDDYQWLEIGKRFVNTFPEESLRLAEVVIPNLGKDGTILGGYSGYHTRSELFLDDIAKKYPMEVWSIIIKYIDPTEDHNSYYIQEWLKGGNFFEKHEGAISNLPAEEIWKWVDRDIEHRAWWFTHFVPKVLFREEGKICWAREVLVRYGNREDVRNNLMANFSTEGWSGPSSQHFQQKKDGLLKFKQSEDNENVKKWIDDYVNSLDRQIEHAKISEERREY